MKKVLSVLVISLLGPVLAATVVLGPAPSSATNVRRPSRRVMPPFDRVLGHMRAQMEAADVPGGAIAIVENGVLTYAAGLGVKAAGGTDEVQPTTLFRVASITKMMVGAASLILVDQGRLDLHAPITDQVPYLQLLPPHDPSSVTMHQLLTQTAGIPNTLAEACDAEGEGSLYFASSTDLPLWSPPGRLFNYSNLGISLAGLAVEEAAGVPFSQAMQELLLDPAGMTGATFDKATAASRDHALGHDNDSGSMQYVHPETFDCPMDRPAGGLYASVIDYARFAELLFSGGGGVLSPQMTATMLTPMVDTQWTPVSRYGYGLVFDPLQDLSVVWHTGGGFGFSTAFWMVPEQSFAVAVFFNGYGEPWEVAKRAVELFHGLPPTTPPSYATSPSTWHAYAGTYLEPCVHGIFRVYLEGEQLWIELESYGTTARMLQSAGHTFTFENDDGTVVATFWLDDTGQAEYMATRGGVGRRIESGKSSTLSVSSLSHD